MDSKATPPPPTSLQLPRIKVLLVEDNPGDARLIRILLEGAKLASFDLVCTGTLAEGIERLHEESFDAVLVDLGLPDSQGLETFERLHDGAASVPIVVLSGLGDDQLGLQAVAEGAQDYLVKGKVETDVLERSLRYALQRKRVEEDLRSKEHLLRELLALQERERQLTAYDIHDGFLQDVIAAQMVAESILYDAQKLDADSNPIEKVCVLLSKAIDEGRHLISELRPIIIDEKGIVEAIHYLIGEEANKGGLDVYFRHDVPFDRLPRLLEGTLFRIVQEALTNVKRHSQVQKAEVHLTHADDRVKVVVRDEGVGFEQSGVSNKRFGLRGIQERARLFGGTSKVVSQPGHGTSIEVVLPLSLSLASP